MKTEWCEHITYKDFSFKFPDESGYRFHRSNCDITIKDWKLCPVCGAERPKEARKLAEIIGCALGVRTDYIENHGGAKACLDAVEEIINDRIQTRAPNSDWTRSLQDIKQAIRERLL